MRARRGERDRREGRGGSKRRVGTIVGKSGGGEGGRGGGGGRGREEGRREGWVFEWGGGVVVGMRKRVVKYFL